MDGADLRKALATGSAKENTPSKGASEYDYLLRYNPSIFLLYSPSNYLLLPGFNIDDSRQQSELSFGCVKLTLTVVGSLSCQAPISQ